LDIDVERSKCFTKEKISSDLNNENRHCKDHNPSGTYITAMIGGKNNDIGVIEIALGLHIVAVRIFGNEEHNMTETETYIVLWVLDHILKKVWYRKRIDIMNLNINEELEMKDLA